MTKKQIDADAISKAAREARAIAAEKGFDSPEAFEARMRWNALVTEAHKEG